MADKIIVRLSGRIDSNNVGEWDKKIDEQLPGGDLGIVVFDAGELEYISSAGLRLIMKVLKRTKIKPGVINVSPEVYEIFSVTGFTELMNVEKRLRELSVDGAEFIGAGAYGRVYKLDSERIIKVFNKVSNPPEKIKREQAAARNAFVHGIPSAIPFDIVRVGDELGMIYELINARTLGKTVHDDPGNIEEYALKMSSLLKKLHSTEMKEGTMQDARNALRQCAEMTDKSGYLSKENIQVMHDLIEAIPTRNTFIHGDFHPGNIMVSDGELILIDMGDASVGHPVNDLMGTYHLMSLVPSVNDKAAMRYLGMTSEETMRMWNIFIRDYLGTDDDSYIREIESSLRSYSQMRTLSAISFSDVVTDEKRAFIANMAMNDLLRCKEKASLVLSAL